MWTPDAKKGSEGELPFSVCFFAIEGDDRLGVLEECGAIVRVPKKFAVERFFCRPAEPGR
jgi:hypothetical protein